jgi:hypothetical protein
MDIRVSSAEETTVVQKELQILYLEFVQHGGLEAVFRAHGS